MAEILRLLAPLVQALDGREVTRAAERLSTVAIDASQSGSHDLPSLHPLRGADSPLARLPHDLPRASPGVSASGKAPDPLPLAGKSTLDRPQKSSVGLRSQPLRKGSERLLQDHGIPRGGERTGRIAKPTVR